MKFKEGSINLVLFMLIAGTVLFYACGKDNPVAQDDETRLFRPVLNEQLFAEDNMIIVDMGDMKDAASYTLEVSRDTFQTVELALEVDTHYVEIDSLLWDTIYQVRATAHADDEELDSKVSDLGAVRTQRFPSIMELPESYDVTDVAARVFWETGGAPVTGVKVFAADDEKLTSPLIEEDVSMEEQDAEEKFVYGLEPSTEYQIAIYSDGELRGWADYTTKEALPMGDNVVDLRGIDRESILADTLQYVSDGSVVLLESGRQYAADGYHFDKSVTIRSAYGFTPGGATIDCSSNFNVQDGAVVDSVVFRDVTLTGNFDSNYVFNINNSGQVGEIKFHSSNIRSLRGITRMKGGAGKLEKYTIYNSVVDSINGYAVLTVDTEEWSVDDIRLENSTFSKIQYFLVSRSNTNSILIESSTINEAPERGRQMFRWRGSEGNNNVLNGVEINNTIWGHGWNMDGEEDYAVSGVDGMENTNFSIVNTYTTNQFSFSGDEIPGFPSFVYDGTANDLWENPYNGVGFDIQDSGFAGKGDAGDPRWRIGL
ncbi:DUF4957 domain-containing protein [Aliifodinibius sp. S!AR15-10]|uniref:DUF5123 domain-containing protein n=1 Tax=Aliifodinibius sp. S!AR15-10 TaxID=2950437 RepID=UPI002858D926|nr:DUF5123 domain-containing protein [Aliifodinibius sp. S!AR15-10]MDR8393601.1 DUF4957 domain-containing protein [Aliifodinibius sp. S!AR15-10]